MCGLCFLETLRKLSKTNLNLFYFQVYLLKHQNCSDPPELVFAILISQKTYSTLTTNRLSWMYKQTNVTVDILIKQHPILLQIKSNQISNTFADKTFQDRYAQMQNIKDRPKESLLSPRDWQTFRGQALCTVAAGQWRGGGGWGWTHLFADNASLFIIISYCFTVRTNWLLTQLILTKKVVWMSFRKESTTRSLLEAKYVTRVL